MMLEFLQIFYLATTTCSKIYILSNRTALHNIYEIINFFTKYTNHNQLEVIIVPMEVKFMKYYNKLQLLYCFGPHI